jgi:hypothetical protein
MHTKSLKLAGGDFFLWFRLYGPEKPVFDGSWTLPDVEIAEQ